MEHNKQFPKGEIPEATPVREPASGSQRTTAGGKAVHADASAASARSVASNDACECLRSAVQTSRSSLDTAASCASANTAPQFIHANSAQNIALVLDDIGRTVQITIISRPMTRDELAEYYKVDERTIDNWRTKKIIPYSKVGGIVRFDIVEVNHAMSRFKKRARKTKP